MIFKFSDHLKMGDEMFRFVDETFPVLLKTLSDPSDEVVLLSLEVLAEIVSFPCKSRGWTFYFLV